MNKFLQKMDNLRRQIHDDKVNIHDTDMAYKRSKGDGMKMYGGDKSPLKDKHGMKMMDKSPVMRHCTPMRMDYGMKMKDEAKRDLMDMPLTKDMTGGRGPKMYKK